MKFNALSDNLAPKYKTEKCKNHKNAVKNVSTGKMKLNFARLAKMYCNPSIKVCGHISQAGNTKAIAENKTVKM